MTKRAEIKEAFEFWRDDECLYPDKVCVSFEGSYCLSVEEAYKCLMQRLDEIGVVIKVDGKLPLNPYAGGGVLKRTSYKRAQLEMLKWHEDSLEPLIKE